jgi:hypothetical protein
MNHFNKFELAERILRCTADSNLNRCTMCVVRDTCDELFAIIKRRFLPKRSEADVKTLIEIFDKRRGEIND